MKFINIIIFLENKIEEVRNKDNEDSRYIIRAYKNVISKIKENYTNNEIITKKKILYLPITDHMKDKLSKFHKGTLKDPIAKIKITKKSKLKKDLINLYGIGSKIAEKLIKEGLLNINDLQKNKWLKKIPLQSKKNIKFKTIKKIPHKHIQIIEKHLKKIKKNITIVGSYRRKTNFSKDIDIMIVF